MAKMPKEDLLDIIVSGGDILPDFDHHEHHHECCEGEECCNEKEGK